MKLPLCLIATTLMAPWTSAQMPAANPTAASIPDLSSAVVVTQIKPEGQLFDGRSFVLTLGLKEGFLLPPGAVVLDIGSTRVVNETGTPARTGRGGTLFLGTVGINVSSTLATVNIAGIPLAAKQVKLLEGTILMVIPSEAAGTLVRLPNFQSRSGRLEHAALERHGIQLLLVADKASSDTAKALIAPMTTPALDRFEDPSRRVVLAYRDPESRIADIQIRQADGALVRSTGGGRNGGQNGGTRTIQFRDPLPANAQLLVTLRSSEAIHTLPFRVENIALPELK